jgi:hypothetical protein
MHRVPLLHGSHDHSRNRMFFLWREAAALAFIVTLMATASQMDACARPAIVLVHMVAGVCRRAITLRRPRDMGRLLGMGRPPGRRPAAIPDTLHRKILLRRRQEATRLRPDLKRVHLPASEGGKLASALFASSADHRELSSPPPESHSTTSAALRSGL